ncbi:hypothetical protein NKH77_09275 [Streptomyces sp. M19]
MTADASPPPRPCTRAPSGPPRPDLDTAPMDVVGPVKRIQALLATALEPLYEGAPLTAPNWTS